MMLAWMLFIGMFESLFSLMLFEINCNMNLILYLATYNPPLLVPSRFNGSCRFGAFLGCKWGDF